MKKCNKMNFKKTQELQEAKLWKNTKVNKRTVQRKGHSKRRNGKKTIGMDILPGILFLFCFLKDWSIRICRDFCFPWLTWSFSAVAPEQQQWTQPETLYSNPKKPRCMDNLYVGNHYLYLTTKASIISNAKHQRHFY